MWSEGDLQSQIVGLALGMAVAFLLLSDQDTIPWLQALHMADYFSLPLRL